MKGLAKINIPIHLIPALIFKLRQMAKTPISSTAKLTINILRSVMFLTSFVMSIISFQCYGSKMFPHLSVQTLHLITVLFSGFGIAFEQPHKRKEITYYCLPRSLEGLWNFLEKRRIVKTFKYQDIVVFALSMGVIAMCYGDGSKPLVLRGFTLKACKSLWDDTPIKKQAEAKVEDKEVENKDKEQQ